MLYGVQCPSLQALGLSTGVVGFNHETKNPVLLERTNPVWICIWLETGLGCSPIEFR